MVGKSWNSAVTTFLYMRPVIKTQKQLRCLCRSLQASPRLPSLVLALIIVAPSEQVPPRNIFRLKVRSWLSTFRETHPQEAVRTILKLCSSHQLESMMLSTSASLPNTSTAPIVIFSQILGEGWPLRKLVIDSNAFIDHTLFGRMDLPQLEILHLRSLVLNRFTTFPHLPRVSVVQVVKCYISYQAPLFFDEQRLPNLRSLGFYQCEFKYCKYLTYLITLENLERLCIVEYNSESPILWAGSSGQLAKVPHLTIGTKYPFSPVFAHSFRFPRSLRTLTVLGVSPGEEWPIDDFIRCLTSQFEQGRFQLLEMLYVVGEIGCDANLEPLRSFCEQRGVQTELQGQDVEGWINQHLDTNVPSRGIVPLC
ncbi:hypothetical protein NLI96_g643 [Meripilus lineatus]|uniref:F-box domain-containing protein n=1 Tax=Meripilus lineatus TaxID=2056292 RepID=A0AAD5VHJ5_9APHY|nr:hypothetical protein NLI96_g643 [Physisporinus lineatus]